MKSATALAVLVVWIIPLTALAVPPAVSDRLWGLSHPWIVFNASAPTLTVTLSELTSSCADPIAARASTEFCAGPPAVDVIVHLFESGSAGEVATPLRCTSATCTASFAATSGSGVFGLLVHSGPGARGLHSGSYTVRADGVTIASGTVSLSDNLMIDLTDGSPSGYDIVSVLVPDGPRRLSDGTVIPGNDRNDFLGVDATEAWLLGEDFRVVGADLQQSGTGPAALVTWSALMTTSPTRWVVVRPWSPPPPSFSVFVDGAAVPIASGVRSPTVGAGRMRVIINDWYGTNDPDADGLSSAVERAFHTCDGASPFSGVRACVTADNFMRRPDFANMDPRDSDGDGISDAAEVLGSDVAWGTLPQANGACAMSGTPSMITDADQTFPLWGFSPLHKDMLFEIDRGSTQDGAATACTIGSPVQGCRPDNAVFPIRPSDPPNAWKAELLEWRRAFAGLPASRVNNPDGLPGIEVHFDVRATAVATAGHGTVPDFTVFDATGQPLPGLVVFAPPGRSGSQCSCRGQFMCASPLHGGFARYVNGSDAAGGGESGCNGRIDVGLGRGNAGAHETGHHLGLSHGGPEASCGNPSNPFGLREDEVGDLALTGKIVHVSLMNYAYAYDSAIGFSQGENIHHPLPRALESGFGFPEHRSVGGRSTALISRYQRATPRFVPGPSMCSGSGCVDTDFDRDGAWSGIVSAPLEAGEGYIRGRRSWVLVSGWWCPSEGRPASAPCCRTGTYLPATGMCSDNTAPNEPHIANTMLLASQPAVTIADNRLYTFFVDDLISATSASDPTMLPRRCTAAQRASGQCCPVAAAAAGLCSGAATPPMGEGKLRWAAADRFAVPAPMTRRQYPCVHPDDDCRAPGTGMPRPEQGDLQVDGALARGMTGTTLLAATTLRAGPTETVVLAWTSRSALACTPRTTTCQDSWGPLQVRFGAGATLETSGMQTVGRTGTALFPAGRGEHVSGVALAAWDPASDGAPSRAFLVAREARSPGNPAGELFYTICDGITGCGVMQALVLTGESTPIRSETTIAAAVDHPSGGAAPTLSVLYGRSNNPGGDPSAGRLTVARLVATMPSGSFSRTQWPVRDRAGGRAVVALESAVSLAFTGAHGDRLIMAGESISGSDAMTVYLSTASYPYAAGATAILGEFEANGDWDYSRSPVGVVVDPSTSVLRTLRADAPGSVPALIHDDRAGVTGGDPRIAYLEGRVRSARIAQGGSGLLFSLTTMADPAILEPHFNYEEVATLAFGICQAIEASSRGRRGPDLLARGSALGPLRCPSALDWGENSGLVANVAARIHHYCRPPCPETGPPRYFEDIARVIVNPALYGSLGLKGSEQGVLPPVPLYAALACHAEQAALAYLAAPVSP